MRKYFSFITLIILLPVLFLSSCEMSNNPGMQNNNFMTVTPADNSQNIGVNDAITIQFEAPVNPAIVEKNFVLISSRDINDSLCPQNHMMGHSDMHKAMSDMNMMEHLKSSHATKGKFSWNSDNTKCIFKADSTLEPDMDYMMFVDKDMMSHMKNTMMAYGMMNNGMGMMNCDCAKKGNDNTEMMMHFKTKAN